MFILQVTDSPDGNHGNKDKPVNDDDDSDGTNSSNYSIVVTKTSLTMK